MLVKQVIAFSLIFLSLGVAANEISDRPDYHAPIGVMRDHIHQKGKNYDFLSSQPHVYGWKS